MLMMCVSASIIDGVSLRLNQAADPGLWNMTEELLARDPESAKRCAEDHLSLTACTLRCLCNSQRHCARRLDRINEAAALVESLQVRFFSTPATLALVVYNVSLSV